MSEAACAAYPKRRVEVLGLPMAYAEVGAGDPVVFLHGNPTSWLERATVPKLLIVADPGAALRGEQLAYCRTWPHQTEVTVPGLHFIQEDSPDQIGSAVAAWLRCLS